MNWNHFILLLTGLYLGYYTINILADLYLKRKPQGNEAEQDVLFFSEDSQPEIILYEDEPERGASKDDTPKQNTVSPEPVQNFPAPPLESTGAVSLKELIQVAQKGVLQYTKAIPY